MPELKMLLRLEQGSRPKTQKTSNYKAHLRFNSGSGIYTPIVAGYYHVCSYARSHIPSLIYLQINLVVTMFVTQVQKYWKCG